MPESRIRHYAFTCNNPKVTLQEISDRARAGGAQCFAGQLERGESGTPHYQCHVSFKEAKSHARVMKMFQPDGHNIQPARDPGASYLYCLKDDDTVVKGADAQRIYWGEAPKPRKNVKGDTQAFNQMVIKFGPERMVEDGQISIKDYRKLKENVTMFKLHTATHANLDELTHEWHYGPPGVGKSRNARLKNPGLYVKMPNKWWDGYMGEDAVLIDDVQPSHACLGWHIKIWADHYPFKAEIKGSTTEIRPKKIVITSNYHPSQIWRDDPVMVTAIMRRFKMHHWNAPLMETSVDEPSEASGVHQSRSPSDPSEDDSKNQIDSR